MRFSSFSHHSTGFDVRWGTSFRPNPISIDFEMTHEWRKSSFLSQLVYSPNLTGGCRATPSDLRIGLLVGLLEWQAANSNDLKIKKREEKNKKQHKWYCLLLLLFGVTNGQKLFQMTEKWKNVKNIFRQIWTKTTGVAKMVLNDELTSKWDIPWKRLMGKLLHSGRMILVILASSVLFGRFSKALRMTEGGKKIWMMTVSRESFGLVRHHSYIVWRSFYQFQVIPTHIWNELSKSFLSFRDNKWVSDDTFFYFFLISPKISVRHSDISFPSFIPSFYRRMMNTVIQIDGMTKKKKKKKKS